MLRIWTMSESYEIVRQVSSKRGSRDDMLILCKEQSREFGFLRFSTLDDAQTFMDRHHPVLYLYGDSTKANGDPNEARVRISYGRERKENKTDEADWSCSSVSNTSHAMKHLANLSSATSTTMPPARDALDARLHAQVCPYFFLKLAADGKTLGRVAALRKLPTLATTMHRLTTSLPSFFSSVVWNLPSPKIVLRKA